MRVEPIFYVFSNSKLESDKFSANINIYILILTMDKKILLLFCIFNGNFTSLKLERWRKKEHYFHSAKREKESVALLLLYSPSCNLELCKL